MASSRKYFEYSVDREKALSSAVARLFEPDHIAAHRHCRNHKAELYVSDVCGCFCCLSTFSPFEIAIWLDVENGRSGPTALCPICGIDSVIGSKSGYPITKEFLAEMKKYWFDNPSW